MKLQRCRLMSLLRASCVNTDMDGIGNTMQKKAAELERLAEVLITGEQLRWVFPPFPPPPAPTPTPTLTPTTTLQGMSRIVTSVRNTDTDDRVWLSPHSFSFPVPQSQRRCRKTSLHAAAGAPLRLAALITQQAHWVAPVTFERRTIHSLAHCRSPTLPIHPMGGRLDHKDRHFGPFDPV